MHRHLVDAWGDIGLQGHSRGCWHLRSHMLDAWGGIALQGYSWHLGSRLLDARVCVALQGRSQQGWHLHSHLLDALGGVARPLRFCHLLGNAAVIDDPLAVIANSLACFFKLLQV